MSVRHSPAAIATALTFAEIEPPDLRGPFTYVTCAATSADAQTESLAKEYPWANIIGKDIAQLHSSDLPPRIDMLVLDKVWSWTDAATRAKALDFIGARLSPAGIVVVDYACPPGATLPAVLNRIGLDFAEKALASHSRFFMANPTLPDVLHAMKGRVMNAQVHITPFDEMQSTLRPLGLAFAGSAHMCDAIPKLNFSPASQRLLQAETDVVLREMKKDILLSRGFRCDLFARSPHRLQGEAAAQRLAAARFAPRVSSERVDTMVLRTRYADIKPSETVRRVFAHLSAEGQSAMDLVQRQSPGCENVWSNMEALLVLMAMDAVRPLPPQ